MAFKGAEDVICRDKVQLAIEEFKDRCEGSDANLPEGE